MPGGRQYELQQKHSATVEVHQEIYILPYGMLSEMSLIKLHHSRLNPRLSRNGMIGYV